MNMKRDRKGHTKNRKCQRKFSAGSVGYKEEEYKILVLDMSYKAYLDRIGMVKEEILEYLEGKCKCC